MDLRRQLSVNKVDSEMDEFDKAEELLRKARYLARTVFPYFAGPLTAMSIKMTKDAVYPEPKEYEDDNGIIVQTPRPKHCAGERVDQDGREFWLHPTFAVDEQMRTYIHPLAVHMWIDEAKEVSPSKPCKTCGKTHHHPLAYVAGVFVHEMWHPLRKHGRRARNYKQDFNHQMWNVAADCEINDNIREYVKTSSLDRLCLPEGGQFPDTYKMDENLLAEEYYTLLQKKAEEKQKQKGNKKQKGGGDSQKMPEGGRCGSGADGQKKDYEDGDGEGKGKGEQQGGQQPQPGKGDSNDGVGEGEIDAMARRVAQDIQDSNAKNPGTVPAGLVRWAGEMLGPPKYNWRQELTSLIRYCSTRFTAGHKISTYSRLARVSSVSDFSVIMPTYKKPLPHVAAIIDTSGSMSKSAIRVALEETEGLCKILRTPINIISVDTEAFAKKAKKVSQAVIQGGGGTDMRIGIDKALADREKPSLVIVFTDGFTPWPDKPPRNTKMIVCLCGEKNSVCSDDSIPSWMHIVRVTPDKAE
ncbi:MAG: von Willebrand factor type [Sphingomonadales bacterium]|nr:von Willebrand factor type [Sphingomonadales bacterium]